jgi:hypothetical protein
MYTTLFAGCSYTAGVGFAKGKNEPGLWVNLLHKKNDFLNKTKLLNVAESGRSNAGIFQDAVWAILNNNVKYAFVAWTNVIRYEISVGLECYATKAFFIPGSVQFDCKVNSGTYPASYLQNISDRLTTLAHPHYELVNLIYYINSLILLCDLKKCQLFFVNALCDWDENYFVKKHNAMPEDYTEYTKHLISITTRDDDEIFKLYEKMHDEYNQAGGIRQDKWLNLYKSLRSTLTDTNNDDLHPGLHSNSNYYQQLTKALESKLK